MITHMANKIIEILSEERQVEDEPIQGCKISRLDKREAPGRNLEGKQANRAVLDAGKGPSLCEVRQ